MSWDFAATFFGLAWLMVLPAWSRKSLFVLTLSGLAMFPAVFAIATIANPNPVNEYISMPAIFIGAIGIPVFVVAVIGKGMSLRLDRRLRERDRREDWTG